MEPMERHRYEGRRHAWYVTLGLEVHAQLKTRSKLFSGASTHFGAEPNTQVSFLDAGLPGTLPVLNYEAVVQALRVGLALKATIHRRSVFARKNYFYPDLPSGYQISQYAHPLIGEAAVSIQIGETTRLIRIERIHLEQDAGKSLHDQLPDKTCIDLNRAGVPLIEIVSRPDMTSAAEAVAYVSQLRAILMAVGSCDGNMQEGSLRVDANVSVSPAPEAASPSEFEIPGPLGTRCEIKNLNSLKFMRQAIDYEAQRQIRLLEEGGHVRQETRLFDSQTGETRAMRSKEEAHDYRYFPDPDLLPLEIPEALLTQLARELPELPDARQKRLQETYGLKAADAAILTAEPERADYFERVARGRRPQLVANWVLTELFGRLNRDNLDLAHSPVEPESLGELLDLIENQTISGKIAKTVLDTMMAKTGAAENQSLHKSPGDIVREQGLGQISDDAALTASIQAILDRAPDQLAKYRAGQEKLFGWFVGQTMKETQGKANPERVNRLLRDLLKKTT